MSYMVTPKSLQNWVPRNLQLDFLMWNPQFLHNKPSHLKMQSSFSSHVKHQKHFVWLTKLGASKFILFLTHYKKRGQCEYIRPGTNRGAWLCYLQTGSRSAVGRSRGLRRPQRGDKYPPFLVAWSRADDSLYGPRTPECLVSELYHSGGNKWRGKGLSEEKARGCSHSLFLKPFFQELARWFFKTAEKWRNSTFSYRAGWQTEQWETKTNQPTFTPGYTLRSDQASFFYI